MKNNHPLQMFETKLLGNLRYARASRNLTDKHLEEITLEMVRYVRDIVIPYYQKTTQNHTKDDKP